ncbi:hypothetical protein [Secundilactobacillus kimchicus]|uniref:hypothetical protein n=1 Tax=Secundilactobacillus kimchicus TaxID=528209 RepID=UPI000ACD15AB|nr:hypothetical protein [Secundilactobacillus kimchicus]
MLRGSCDEIVNSTSIHLNQGDILLIDIGCPHSIDYLGSGDLLINILFQDTDINIDLLRGMKSSKSVLYKFMLDRKTSQKTPEPFLLLSQLNDPSIIETLDKLIEEYYLQREFSETIISSYLSILIAQMTRSFTVQSSAVLSKSQVLISDILLDIDNNFKTITLKQTAQKYGYNKNYLSNLFKITLGNSFSEVLNQKKNYAGS